MSPRFAAAPRFAALRAAARGVTLVELALVILIIGITLGMYYSRMQTIAAEQRWTDAENQLAAIHEGLLNYAAKNKTGQRQVEVVFHGAAATVAVRHDLPAGRPILPCPDANGDGLEDRQNQGALPPPDQALTIRVVGDLGNPAAVVGANDLMDHGNCVLQKGALPWRNLPGVFRATDPWGNLHTYRVDPNFANRFLGFDEHTRADAYDARMPWRQIANNAVAPWPQKRPAAFAEMPLRAWTRFDRQSPLPPFFIRANQRPSIVCERAPCPPRPGEINRIVAGQLAGFAEDRRSNISQGQSAGTSAEASITDPVTVITWQPFLPGGRPAQVVRVYDGPPSDPPPPDHEYEVIEGLPFVVLSHGREDRGARLGDNKAPDGRRGVYMAMPLDLRRAADVNNALDFGLGQVAQTEERVQYDPVLNSGTFLLEDPAIDARNWGVRFRAVLMDNGFAQPRGARVIAHDIQNANAAGVHDDIVTWMTADELSQAAYRARILPAPPLPPFGVE